MAKKFLWFLSINENKRHLFHFHQELYWTTYSSFCSITFCHFPGNFIISSSQNILYFWVKNCFRCLLQSSKELKFFPLGEFCKDQNKWTSKGAMSGEYGRWIRTYQPSCNNSFCLVIKETCGLALSWGRIMRFLLTNSGCFSSSAAFSWSNWEKYLELTVWFPEEAHNRGLHSNPTIYTASLFGWKPAFGVVGGGSFYFLHDLLHFTLLYSIHFSSPVTIYFNNGMFSLCLSRELHAEI